MTIYGMLHPRADVQRFYLPRGQGGVDLRTVPNIVIAHTFFASPGTRISYRQCLLIQGSFCAVSNYPEKVDHSKYSWYAKRKLEVTMHFWEIIKLQFEQQRHTLPCILKLFTVIIHGLSLKNAWLPPIFLLDFNRTCLNLHFLHNHTPGKSIFN